MDSETIILINPSGRFVVGGPQGDSGLTGRKIIKNFDLRNLPAKNGGKFYQKLAAYGHLGRTDLVVPWENLDKVDTLKKSLATAVC